MTTRTAPKKAARRKAPAKKKATARKAAPAKAAAKPAKKKPTPKTAEMVIKAPSYKTVLIHIKGSTPLMINAFSRRKRSEMQAMQEGGDAAKQLKKPRSAKDFDREYREAAHVSSAGWHGIHAAAFRNAFIASCKVAGAVMAKAKLAVWITADGYDADSSDPLVRIYGKPHMDIRPVRVGMGKMDLRSRPIYPEWKVRLRINFDEDVFSIESIYNLVIRAGVQVNVGEARNDSKSGNGMGFGQFEIVDAKDW